MTAGVPGAGIAGLFYLAGALLAPLWQLARGAGATPHPWRFVVRLALLALAMLTGIFLAGLLIALVLAAPSMPAYLSGVPAAVATTPSFIARATVFLTLGTLIAVLVGVELLALLVGARRVPLRRSRRAAAATHASGPSS